MSADWNRSNLPSADEGVRYEFIDELPEVDEKAATRPGRHEYVKFFRAVRANPGRWAMFPEQKSSDNRRRIARNIIFGNYAGACDGEFEAVNRNAILYVRFVGVAE